MLSLQDSPSVLLDKKTTAGLASLNITTVGELLRYPPRRYMSQGHLDQRERLEAGEWTTVVGTITSSQMISMRRKHGQFLKVVVDDGHQRIAGGLQRFHACQHACLGTKGFGRRIFNLAGRTDHWLTHYGCKGEGSKVHSPGSFAGNAGRPKSCSQAFLNKVSSNRINKPLTRMLQCKASCRALR